MSGQAQEALKVYERMLTAGALPTATTYTALISAYGKNGQLDRALQIFDDMVRALSVVNSVQAMHHSEMTPLNTLLANVLVVWLYH